MNKLEASLQVIEICASLIEKSTYTATVVFDSREMIKCGILDTISKLQDIVDKMEDD